LIKILVHTLILLISISIIFIGLKIYNLEIDKRDNNVDLVELSKVKYGLFNVDVWKDKVSNIITKKVNKFKIDKTNRPVLTRKINRLLINVVNELKEDTRDRNKRQAIFGIDYKNMIADITGVFEQLDENIPKITQQIISFLDSNNNKTKIKKYILQQLNKYSADTFSKTDYSTRNTILAKYKKKDVKSTINVINKNIHLITGKQNKLVLIFTLLLIGQLVFIFVIKRVTLLYFLSTIITSIVLLLLGLLLPMINIDARIQTLSFQLLGEPISFTNQILYFKSKSILEVVWLMISQEEIKMIIVGVFIFMFSVLFPFVKIITSITYLFHLKIRNNKWVNIIVFKIGKWSMADVMVVAILMSFIGFSGIISEQLNQLKNINIEILTTNNSSLQIGFYFFFAFTILSLFISSKLIKLGKR